MPADLSKQLVVRVDAGLLRRLQKDAKDNGRTVAQSVRHLLRKVLDA